MEAHAADTTTASSTSDQLVAGQVTWKAEVTCTASSLTYGDHPGEPLRLNLSGTLLDCEPRKNIEQKTLRREIRGEVKNFMASKYQDTCPFGININSLTVSVPVFSVRTNPRTGDRHVFKVSLEDGQFTRDLNPNKHQSPAEIFSRCVRSSSHRAGGKRIPFTEEACPTSAALASETPLEAGFYIISPLPGNRVATQKIEIDHTTERRKIILLNGEGEPPAAWTFVRPLSPSERSAFGKWHRISSWLNGNDPGAGSATSNGGNQNQAAGEFWA